MTKTNRTKQMLSTRKVTGSKAVYALREAHCKWPIGEPGQPGFHFCGKTSDEGSPYCDQHRQKALRA
ncbi:MAG: GcrA family cell cycle regulator [Pseudomonadota bacterium]